MNNVRNNISLLKGTNIIFQPPVALLNDLVRSGNLEGAASCFVHRYWSAVLSCIIDVTSTI
jgi:hypothetical protein